jgi:hypothetical protein
MGFGARFSGFPRSIVHARLLCLQRASACVVFSRRPLPVRFRGIPAFTVSVSSARKSESDPKATSTRCTHPLRSSHVSKDFADTRPLSVTLGLLSICRGDDSHRRPVVTEPGASATFSPTSSRPLAKPASPRSNSQSHRCNDAAAESTQTGGDQSCQGNGPPLA